MNDDPKVKVEQVMQAKHALHLLCEPKERLHFNHKTGEIRLKYNKGFCICQPDLKPPR